MDLSSHRGQLDFVSVEAQVSNLMNVPVRLGNSLHTSLVAQIIGCPDIVSCFDRTVRQAKADRHYGAEIAWHELPAFISNQTGTNDKFDSPDKQYQG